LAISFCDSPGDNLITGYEQKKVDIPDLNPESDQFILRFLEDKLKDELVVRLQNGYPTTEREADEFDEKAKRNAVKAEEYVRSIIDASSLKPHVKEEMKEVLEEAIQLKVQVQKPEGEDGEKEEPKEEKAKVEEKASTKEKEKGEEKKGQEKVPKNGKAEKGGEEKPKKPATKRVYIGVD